MIHTDFGRVGERGECAEEADVLPAPSSPGDGIPFLDSNSDPSGENYDPLSRCHANNRDLLGPPAELLRGEADWLEVHGKVPKANREGRAFYPRDALKPPRNDEHIVVTGRTMGPSSPAPVQDDPLGSKVPGETIEKPTKRRAHRNRLRHHSITSFVPRRNLRDKRPLYKSDVTAPAASG